MIYLLAIQPLIKKVSWQELARWLDKNWTNCPPTDPLVLFFVFLD